MSAQHYKVSAVRETSSTWSPAATGGKRLRAAQTPDATCRFPPASSAPSAAPALVPIHIYSHKETDTSKVKCTEHYFQQIKI